MVQIALQPSPSTVLPSSHSSPGSRLPSPQNACNVHTLACACVSRERLSTKKLLAPPFVALICENNTNGCEPPSANALTSTLCGLYPPSTVHGVVLKMIWPSISISNSSLDAIARTYGQVELQSICADRNRHGLTQKPLFERGYTAEPGIPVAIAWPQTPGARHCVSQSGVPKLVDDSNQVAFGVPPSKLGSAITLLPGTGAVNTHSPTRSGRLTSSRRRRRCCRRHIAPRHPVRCCHTGIGGSPQSSKRNAAICVSH